MRKFCTELHSLKVAEILQRTSFFESWGNFAKNFILWKSQKFCKELHSLKVAEILERTSFFESWGNSAKIINYEVILQVIPVETVFAGTGDILPWFMWSCQGIDLRSQQSFVLHWLNNSLVSKIYVTEFYNVFAFQKLLTCTSHISLLIRFNKTKFFPWNTNTDGNGVNKQNRDMHTKHSEKDNIGKG